MQDCETESLSPDCGEGLFVVPGPACYLRSSYVRATLRDMTKRKAQIGRDGELVRTSVLVTKDTHAALLALAEEGRRPLSWEIREALEAHVAASRSGRVAA